jgi:APA family basic amino acid/polyamine antiporter
VAVALLAFAYGLLTIAGAGAEYVLWGFLLLLGGIPFYVWARSRDPRAAAHESGE